MSILGHALPGASVVDLFAGSGALGLEALSRGARRVEFVELAPRSLAALRQNIEALGADAEVHVRRADALRHVARLGPGAYDIALADPPYTLPAAEELVSRFRAVPFARILAVEHPATRALPGDDVRRYGDTTITFCYAP